MLTVLMIGPGADSKGGMWAVATTIMEAMRDTCRFVFVGTTTSSHLRVAKLAAATRAYWQFVACLLADRPDVVHVHFAAHGSPLRKVPFVATARLFRVPVVLQAHCQGGFPYLAENASPLVLRLLRRSFRGASVFLALTEAEARAYREWLGLEASRVAVVPNVTSRPSKIEVRRATAQVAFLFLGALEDRKGVMECIAAFELAFVDGFPARLIIAGDGPLKIRVEAKASESPCRIDYVGFVSGDEKNQLLRRASVLVLPSYKENFPVVLLEAMAYGLPIVACPVDGVVDILEDQVNGLFCDAGDVTSLATAMRTLATNPDLRLRLGLAARQDSERFDSSTLPPRLLQVYSHAVTGQSHAVE